MNSEIATLTKFYEALPPSARPTGQEILKYAAGQMASLVAGVAPRLRPAPDYATANAAAARDREKITDPSGEVYTRAYAVTCPHFGALTQKGGCSCGKNNRHVCALDGETTRLKCQRCALNTAPAYARLIVAYGCPECQTMKIALADTITADAVKKILLNRSIKVRCLHYMETAAAIGIDPQTNIMRVPDIRAELRQAHIPDALFAPLLMTNGEIISDPAAIAEKIAALFKQD